MTYGRLDVYWPDGPMESYQLSKHNVAIGRSPGNDITLEATAISRYHASLTLRDLQVYLEDLGSVNGTYIDGRKLPANDPYHLTGGEEIQVGEIRMIFHPVDDSPTQPYSPEEVTQRIEYEQPTYRVELVAPDQAVTPGVYVQGMLLIHNLSDEQDRYFIEVDGVPREWVRLERVEAVLEPDEQAHLMLSFKPTRKPDSAPGSYPFTVQVRSKSRPTQTVDAAMTLTVLPYSGFGIDVSKSVLHSGEILPVHVHNQGNAPLQISLSGKGNAGGLRFAFHPPGVMLGAGQRMTVRAQVRPMQPVLFGAPREFPFVVMARSHDASGFIAPIPGRLVVEPLLTGWRLGAVVGAAATGLLFIVLLVSLLLRPPAAPVLADVAVSPAEVVQGDVVTLSWLADGAQDFVVLIDGVPLDPSPAVDDNAATVALDIPGEHILTLIAGNRGGTTERMATVQVYAPLVVANFSASPATQIRYTTLDVVLTWEVPGALRVRLDGMPDEAADVTYDSTDSRLLQLNGVTPLNLTLRAEGGAGQAAEQALTIPVEDPVCNVLEAESPFRAGPSVLHAVLGNAEAGTAVVPDRRDGSGEWLRILGTDGQRVWMEAAALECVNVDPQMLIVDAAPPTPVPTETATPMPTVTPSPLPSATPPPTLTPTLKP